MLRNPFQLNLLKVKLVFEIEHHIKICFISHDLCTFQNQRSRFHRDISDIIWECTGPPKVAGMNSLKRSV